jgi:hypothetical protein
MNNLHALLSHTNGTTSIYFITIVQIRKKNLDEWTTWTLATHSAKNRERERNDVNFKQKYK